MTKLRVLLVDDHAVVRQGLRALIDAQTDIEVVGEASDGTTALGLCQALKPDIVVMDFTLPGLDGVETTVRLKQVSPGVKVLALTVHDDRGHLRQFLEAGASGYALKQSPADELFHAIRTVAGGGIYLDPAIAGKVVGRYVRNDGIKHPPENDRLSDREAEVVRLIAQGFTNKEIATRLAINPKTVETYKARSLEKLRLRSRADLVRYALERGWLREQ